MESKNFDAAGARQLGQFRKRCFGSGKRILLHTQKNGFFRRVNFPCFLFPCKLILQRLNEGKKIYLQPVRFFRLHNQPVVSIWIFCDEMRPVHHAGRAVFLDFQSPDEIKPQMGQVC